MSSIYALGFLESFSSIFSAMFVAAGVLLIAAAIRRFERQQRKVNTVELLSRHFRNLHMPHEALALVSADQFSVGLHAQPPEHSTAYLQILQYLNEMEFVAVLVNSRVVDEELAAQLMRSAVVRSYRSLIEYIMKARAETGLASLFVELEALSHRWSNNRDF